MAYSYCCYSKCLWSSFKSMEQTECYHSHDFIEMAFILSGHGKYKIADRLYDVSEGDIIILNPGQKHQALCTDPSNPATEFFVGLCDVRFGDFPENYLPLHLKDLTQLYTHQSSIIMSQEIVRIQLKGGTFDLSNVWSRRNAVLNDDIKSKGG